MKTSKKESTIETEILTYLNIMPGIFAWKNKTMGVYDPVRKVFRKSNSKFTPNGVPDILGVCNGKFIAIEVKTEKGIVSNDQKKFIKQLEEHGAYTLIARSLQDAREWFNTNKESLYGNQAKEVSRRM